MVTLYSGKRKYEGKETPDSAEPRGPPPTDSPLLRGSTEDTSIGNGFGFYVTGLNSLACAVGPGLPPGRVASETGDLGSAPSPVTGPLDVTARQ